MRSSEESRCALDEAGRRPISLATSRGGFGSPKAPGRCGISPQAWMGRRREISLD